MKLHRLIMLPDGSTHEQARIETDEVSAEQRGSFADCFNGLSCRSTAPTPFGDFRVVWTGFDTGVAIGTFWLVEQMYLCTILAGGFNPEADEWALSTTGGGWARSDMVQGLMEGRPSPFADLAAIPERPLLVGMLVPILDPKTYREVRGVDLILSAVFLDKVAAGR